MHKNKNKTKLGLLLPTEPSWVDLAQKELSEILTDHAYCEQKAASACISLIQQYPQHESLVEELAPIVSEEWEHFRMVLAELKKRRLSLGKQRKDEYVNKLFQFQRKHVSPNERLLDKLLICAMIEARSCERFRLLSLHLNEKALKQFYHTFMVSEAGHYKTFLKLAKQYCGPTETATRWAEMLDFEASMIGTLETRGARMH